MLSRDLLLPQPRNLYLPQMGKQNDLGRLNNGDRQREREMAICGPADSDERLN
jgi:hypothetical protein